MPDTLTGLCKQAIPLEGQRASGGHRLLDRIGTREEVVTQLDTRWHPERLSEYRTGL